MGMAGYNKNLFVGTSGTEGINKSHFIGAVYGMERIMGKADNPVRQLLNYASSNFIKDLPVVYVHTVIGYNDSGELVTRGLYIGDDIDVLSLAANLSLKVNFSVLDEPLKKAVVYLDPAEFKSTWLGNKSIYRTRMAMADKGELIVLAPGLKEFGEDKGIDIYIRKYGYHGTPATLKAIKENKELQNNLSAAAHLIHGSSEGRFSITYCPGFLSREEIESVNFNYADLKEMQKRYDPGKLKDGFNRLPDGEEIFYISNPALGLWALKERLK
jgi:nickel-dependent lactate racemase